MGKAVLTMELPRWHAASLSGNRLAPLGGDLEFVWYKATPSDFNTGFVSDKEVPAQPLPQALNVPRTSEMHGAIVGLCAHLPEDVRPTFDNSGPTVIVLR